MPRNDLAVDLTMGVPDLDDQASLLDICRREVQKFTDALPPFAIISTMSLLRVFAVLRALQLELFDR